MGRGGLTASHTEGGTSSEADRAETTALVNEKGARLSWMELAEGASPSREGTHRGAVSLGGNPSDGGEPRDGHRWGRGSDEVWAGRRRAAAGARWVRWHMVLLLN